MRQIQHKKSPTVAQAVAAAEEAKAMINSGSNGSGTQSRLSEGRKQLHLILVIGHLDLCIHIILLFQTNHHHNHSNTILI